MITRSKQSGLTLPEVVVVIATIALLVGFGLPVISSLLNSFESQSGAKSLISASLASARAIAAKEQRYAGVRFQRDSAGNQYMILIMYEEPARMGDLTIGFRAVRGVKPIKLPDTVIVMDLRYNPRLLNPPGDSVADSDIDDEVSQSRQGSRSRSQLDKCEGTGWNGGDDRADIGNKIQ